MVEEILDCLNEITTRCTYGAVAEVLTETTGRTVIAQSVGRILGERSQRKSWVVNAKTGEPTGYGEKQKHPKLYCKNKIIRSASELKKACLKRVG